MHQKEDYEDLKLKTSTKLSLLGDFRIWVGLTDFMIWDIFGLVLDLRQINGWEKEHTEGRRDRHTNS